MLHFAACKQKSEYIVVWYVAVNNGFGKQKVYSHHKSRKPWSPNCAMPKSQILALYMLSNKMFCLSENVKNLRYSEFVDKTSKYTILGLPLFQTFLEIGILIQNCRKKFRLGSKRSKSSKKLFIDLKL